MLEPSFTVHIDKKLVDPFFCSNTCWQHSNWEVLDSVLAGSAPIKPEAFASSNYISEHPDCLIHSFHYEMKAVSFHSFPFTLHKKRTFIGTHPSCPWEISSTSNIQSFEGKNNGAVSGCMQEEETMCLTRLHKFCHLNASFVSSNCRRSDNNRKTECNPIKDTVVKLNRYTTYRDLFNTPPSRLSYGATKKKNQIRSIWFQRSNNTVNLNSNKYTQWKHFVIISFARKRWYKTAE